MIEAPYLAVTRAAYDTVAASYARQQDDALVGRPLDRALLAAFAELVLDGGGGPVADVGCGPGHVTAHLRSLGLDAFGIDLSPAMVATARLAHPGTRFEEGRMAALDVPDGALGGVLARYSIIHTPPPRRDEVFAEFHRALAPGGHALLVFQVGDDRPVHVEQACGHEVSCEVYRCSPDRVVDQLGRAGLSVRARLVREPDGDEKTRQCALLARKGTTEMS